MSRLLALRHERAFERMYRQHVVDVYRYTLAVLRDPEDAEQVTQTTFRNAYRSVERPQRGHLNWLLAIAHDLCRRRIGHGGLDDRLGPVDGDPAADDVRRALARLSFDEREVLVLREVEGRSYPEIAKLLGCSPATVETLLFAARRSLREGVEAGLTCREAQWAVSRDLDRQTTRRERRLLRAHVRDCMACYVFAQEQHAQRTALRQLANVELPKALASFAERRFSPRAASS